MKYRNIKDGEVRIASTPAEEYAYSHNSDYELVKERKLEDYTINELVAYLTDLGITCNKKMKKTKLLALIPQE